MHLELDKDERRWLAAVVLMQIDDCAIKRGAATDSFAREMTALIDKLEGLLSDIERGVVDLNPDVKGMWSLRERLGQCAKFVRTSGNPEADRQALFYENVALHSATAGFNARRPASRLPAFGADEAAAG